ncbi:C39 family peptidase [Lentibacillus sp.]|uniref:C39 family peptidase n=1 Tax=Lentibacillus sp. TaxID=1925746 RepID=UPI002B4B59CC|nr:C39 family peptidase [Lentibacillus sp.]HLS09860.1 C39 family peptidase [Lentibacillus sp.]
MIKRIVLGFFLITIFFIASSKKTFAPKRNVKITGVPLYYQYPDLPTGCEATSLAMLLSWGRGEPVDKYEVADALPKGDKVRKVDGEWKGTHPNKAFVGDPYTDSDDGSYGVFEGPILETIETFMPDCGIDLTGQPFSSLLDIVRSGKPVMAWTTLEQRETFYGKTWTDDDGDVIDWYENEHAVVLVGVAGNQVIAYDPHTGQAEYYERKLFERNWESMGGRAVTLSTDG